MRPAESPRRLGAPLFVLSLLAVLTLIHAPCALAKKAAPAPQAAPQAEPQGEPVEVAGRIVVGLDKVFIKDAQGYCQVQGKELAPYAGRHVQAKGQLIRQEDGQRLVRLSSYRIQSPDDDSPGAGGEVKQAPAAKGKAKR